MPSRGAIGAGLQSGVGTFMRAFQMLSEMKRAKELDAQRVSEREAERKWRDEQAGIDNTRAETAFTLDAHAKGYTPYQAPVGGGISGDIAALRDLGTDEVVNTPRGSFRYQKPEDPVLARQRSQGEMASAALESLAKDIAAAKRGDQDAFARVVAQSPESARVINPEPKAPVMGSPEWLEAQRALAKIRGENVSQPRERNIDPLSDEGIERGALRAAKLLEAGGGAGAGRISEGERKNSAFYEQARAANDLLDGFTKPGIKDAAVASIPGVGRFMASGDYQRLEQASLQLADAWLRATSGAAITESEVKRNARAFMPQASDKPEVIEQKRNARLQVLESLRRMGGRALQQPSTAPRILKPGEKPPGGFE